MTLALLVAGFLIAAGVVWVAGTWLSTSTDTLDHRLGIGEALGGLILLSITTNLPEIAITASAAVQDNLGIAIGNILGGIAIQTVVLAVLDGWGLGREAPLTYKAASLLLVLECGLVCAVLVAAVQGTQLPSSATIWRLDPASVLIALLWVAGLWLLNRARRGLPWHEQGNAPDAQAEPIAHSKAKVAARAPSTSRAAMIFGVAALMTLAGGVVLEQTGEHIADHIGMSGVIFGSTVLAASTALPEVSTGLSAVRMGDYQLAVSDIFGGNAFLPVLFLLASILAGHAVLPSAQDTDIYLTGLGVLLTLVYMYGLIFRPRRLLWRFGIDSFTVVVLYAIGIVGLVVVAHG